MALTDLTRISTSGISTGSTIDSPILRKDVSFRGTQVGVTSALFDSSDNALEFNDDVQLKFGNSGDFEIYHRGADGVSIINETGSAYLSIGSNGNKVELYDNANNRAMAEFFTGGACSFKHGDTTRFQTTSTGAVVTGVLTASSYSGPISNPSGISTFYDVRVTNNLTVEGSTTTLDTDLIGVDRVEVAANSNSIVGVAITQSGTADIINLFDGNTEVLTVIDGGKVGIGTANPTELIDVLSTSNNATIQVRTTGAGAWFEADSASSGYSGLKLSSGGTQRWLVGSFATNNFTIKDGGTSGDGRFTIVDGTGNIGIGTDAPDTQLEVFGGSTSIQVGNQSGSGRFGADGTSTKIGSHSNHHLDLFTNGVANTRLRIDSNGRVLINTTNNSNGHIAASNLAVQGGDFTIFKDSGGDNADVSGHKLKFVTQSGSIGEIDVLSEGGGGPAGRGGAMRFYTKANNTSSADEKLRITSDGYIKVSGDQGNSDYWGKIYNRSDGFSFHAADGSVTRNITFYIGASTSTERLRIGSNGTSAFTGTVTATGTIESTGTGAGVGGKFGQISVGAGAVYNTIQNTVADTPIHLQYNNTGDIKCNEGGGDLRTNDIIPHTNNSANLGSNTRRWANIHTNDLNLSNEGSKNDVDGTWGQYTIQEGQSDLFLINRRSGKRYKFLLQEVD